MLLSKKVIPSSTYLFLDSSRDLHWLKQLPSPTHSKPLLFQLIDPRKRQVWTASEYMAENKEKHNFKGWWDDLPVVFDSVWH